MPVAVVTDTTHYLPRELVAAEELHEVSLYVETDGDRRRESDIDVDDFYRDLRTSDRAPKTSAPSIGDVLAVYEPLLESGHDIVSVHLSPGVSATLDVCRQAAAEVAGRFGQRRIELLDSGSAAGGAALVLLAAAAARRDGGDVDAVAARVRAAREDAKVWFAVETLEYLRRGGRIGAAQALLGGALKVKPILTFDETITPVERVRTSARAFERLKDYLRARKEDGATGWCVQHIDAADQAARLADAGREIMGCEPLFVSQVGPVIGAHIGPGLLGVGGLSPALVEAR